MQFQSLINGVTDLVKQTLHRDIESTQYTEYHSGNNTSELILNQYPIIGTPTRVCVDDNAYFGSGANAFPVANDLIYGSDYAIEQGQKGLGSSGILRRIGAVWWHYPSWAPGRVARVPSAPNGNILVVYTAGYSPVPPSISMAVNDAILRKALTMEVGGGVQSMGYEDGNVSMLSPKDLVGVFGAIERTLGSYKAPPV